VSEKIAGKFTPKMPDLHVAFRDLSHVVNVRHGTNGFTSLPKGRRAEDFFFAPKNPTASAGFEPENLGSNGQQATSRPPKPLWLTLYCHLLVNTETLNLLRHAPENNCRKIKNNRKTENNAWIKGKAIPLQAWTGPQGSSRLRLPDF
jgi:hypothetical protein